MKGTMPMRQRYQNAARLLESMERTHLMWRRLAPPPPLSRGDFALLTFLHTLEQQGKPAATVGMLAREMKQSPPGISQKVSWLEKQGYLQRHPDEEDRRLTYVELTARGRAVASETLQGLMATLENALEGLGPGKAQTLLGLMEQLTHGLDRVDPACPGQKGEGKSC